MTKKNFLAMAAVALMFGGMGAYVGLNKNEAPVPLTSSVAPNPDGAHAPVTALFALSLPDVGGHGQALSQWKGKVLVLNFWAPWCAPCVQEMPELSALAQDKAYPKVQIIGIGIDTASNITEFAAKFKIAYPLYVAGMSGTDLARSFGNGGGGLPYTVLIGADGQVRKTYLGRLNFDQLKADLAALKS